MSNAADADHVIQVLDLIRHLVKAFQECVVRSDALTRDILQSADTYTVGENSPNGSWLLNRLSEMSSVPLTASSLDGTKSPISPGEQPKRIIETVGRVIFFAENSVSDQPGLFALWVTPSGTGGTLKSAVLELLVGSQSRMTNIDSPQIDFAELKAIGLKNKRATPRSEESKYVTFIERPPFGYSDNRPKELSLREKGAFLMILLKEMEKLDSTAHRRYVAMLDSYKRACAKERTVHKRAGVVLKKAGHVSMFGDHTSPDYDEQFPDPNSDNPSHIAHLSRRMDIFEGQLQNAEDATEYWSRGLRSRAEVGEREGVLAGLPRLACVHGR